MEKISIIIPVYNVEKYLEKCVNSILNQTYKNLEIILIDDGSTDNSGKIANDLSKKDNRIKVIHKENGGASTARNEGLKVITGDFVSFIDSDDIIPPDFYQYLYELIKKYDSDIAQCKFLRIASESIDNTDKILNEANSKIEISEEVIDGREATNIYYGVEEEPYIQEVVVMNKLYKRKVLDDVTFIVGKVHEDEFTTHKILFKCNKIVVSNKYLYGYIQSDNSVMRKAIKLSRIKNCLEASLDSIEFYKKNNIDNIIYKICMRYLSNCVELSGKVRKEESPDKEEKLKFLTDSFRKFYEENIELIEKNVKDDELEVVLLNLIKRVYSSNDIATFANELSLLIHEKVKNEDATTENLRLREIVNSENRAKLKNTNFSVISSNCNGGFILHDLGQRFNSPTVNLYLFPKDFIKLVKNLKYYMSLKLSFVKEDGKNYPIGVLDDIRVYFMHYKSEEEAENKWEERKKRINYDNIFIMMTDKDGCTYEDLKEFDSLEYKNKVVFTHLDYPEFKSACYIKGYENQVEVGHIYEFLNGETGLKHYDEFDYISWFNNEKD